MDQERKTDRPQRPRPRPQRPPAGREGEDAPPRRRSAGRRSLFPNPWMYLLFIFGVSAILAALCWTAANDVLALNKAAGEGVITVSEEDRIGDLVDELEQKGLIEYKTLFRVFSFFMGANDKIAPGTYRLNTDMDYRAIINGLGGGGSTRMSTRVSIPEGYTVAQIFQLLEEKQVCSVAQLEDMASTHDYAFSFLQDIPLGDPNRLEGFLFPDTYDFYMGENPLYVINKMLVNFDAKVTDDMRARIAEQGYTVRELIAIASMIEKETDGTDRGNIASVIYNRLGSNVTNGYLQIDATLQYVLPEGQFVTQADYTGLDSLYNTYLHTGLPPGPIANPGLESIAAAMSPESTNYYYYALGSDGVHHFFTNYSDHQAFVSSQSGQ